ncbi:MAG: hypothetical protein IK012_07140 [Fibrobacter sp.]|uniref:FISUMP domain-containing protein n=1 Tax=Fibrobacter sp. TaxID=35828 RepID=UPI0025BF4C7A|nr:FISUMP domain-containing protein [Fibrobacter sp.]MBR4785013.1 hypothetical protein [Fibrobacter sp.]
MKNHILFVGILGVFSLFAGCTTDGDKHPLYPIDEESSATDSADSAKSSSSAGKNKSSSSGEPSSSVDGSDTSSVVHKEFYMEEKENRELSYPSSGIFCWDEDCDARRNPISSSSSSSSEKIIIAESSESNVPPTVNGNSMTDNRDGKTYKLQNVGGKLWMAEDLNHEMSNSMCFDKSNANCDKYGRLYTFTAAQKACPTGWKLPNRNEAQTILNASDYPWSYSGRCKEGDCDFTGKMGFHWTTATAQEGDKKYGENSGEKFAVIIVEKEPDYAGEDTPKFFQVDEKAKFFSVRCVQE